MKADIKNYLHFYLGCQVKCGIKTVAILTADETTSDKISIHTTLSNPEYKPILRPLSSMTTEESKRWNLMVKSYQSYANTVKYFIDKHFDLFGLIEAGLAIDATAITPGIP